MFFYNVRAPSQEPLFIRVASDGGIECGEHHVLIAIQRNGADRFAVFAEGFLLHSERQFFIDVGDTGVSHLAQEQSPGARTQEVVQVRRHTKVGVTDFLAKLPQIHQRTERVGLVVGA